jgi:hypothetical protein
MNRSNQPEGDIFHYETTKLVWAFRGDSFFDPTAGQNGAFRRGFKAQSAWILPRWEIARQRASGPRRLISRPSAGCKAADTQSRWLFEQPPRHVEKYRVLLSEVAAL